MARAIVHDYVYVDVNVDANEVSELYAICQYLKSDCCHENKGSLM